MICGSRSKVISSIKSWSTAVMVPYPKIFDFSRWLLAHLIIDETAGFEVDGSTPIWYWDWDWVSFTLNTSIHSTLLFFCAPVFPILLYSQYFSILHFRYFRYLQSLQSFYTSNTSILPYFILFHTFSGVQWFVGRVCNHQHPQLPIFGKSLYSFIYSISISFFSNLILSLFQFDIEF